VNVLINADALHNALDAVPIPPEPAPPTVLDVRWRLGGPPGADDYAAGHIPGAAFLDLDSDLSGPPGNAGRHPLPDPAHLQHALRAVGVSEGRPVVVYDGGDGMAAARAWWTLRWAGHRDVRVLHGGYPAWIAGGYPVETLPLAESAPGDFTVVPGGMPMIDADGAAKFSANGVLVDARAAPRYRGEVEPVDPVAGHIPGAVNLPYADLVEPDGRLRSVDALRARFAASGIEPDGSTAAAAYCGSGVTAAHTILAMTLAGIDDASLYVGSWSQWITNPDRPIATGEQS
jgi:thiosulfate/3-mercaptopyruvate sulfurtransferase